MSQGTLKPATAMVYRPDVDGLRAIAVVAVVIFHAFPSALRGGFTGVDIFFVISGFLISSFILKRLEGGTFSFTDFYLRRMRRLFPALITVLVFLAVFGWFVLLPVEYRRLGKHIAAGIGFSSNFMLWTESGYFDTDAWQKPLLHLWSLAVEEQFYLVWPLLLVVARRRQWATGFLITAILLPSFLLGFFQAGHDPAGAFYSPLTRAWEFMAGAGLACWHSGRLATHVGHSQVQSVLGLGLIFSGFFMGVPENGVPAWWALLPVTGTVLVIAAGPESWINQQLLSRRLMVATGLISYPLYLWHWVALYVNSTAFEDPPSRWSRALAVAISVVLAILTYGLIEIPIRLNRRASARALALAGAAVFAVGTAIYALDGLPSRTSPVVLQLIAAEGRGQESPANGCRSPDGSALEGPCQRDKSRPLIVVWGDSHAGHLAVGLRTLAQDVHADLIEYSYQSCPPLVGFQSRGNRDCQQINGRVVSSILSAKPALIVLNARWDADAYDLTQLANTAEALKDLLPRIVIIGPAPKWHGTLERQIFTCSRQAAGGAIARWSTCGLDRNSGTADNTMAAMSHSLGISYISTYNFFCNADGCMRYTDSDDPGLTTYDYGHLSPSAARTLARHIFANVGYFGVPGIFNRGGKGWLNPQPVMSARGTTR